MLVSVLSRHCVQPFDALGAEDCSWSNATPQAVTLHIDQSCTPSMSPALISQHKSAGLTRQTCACEIGSHVSEMIDDWHYRVRGQQRGRSGFAISSTVRPQIPRRIEPCP